MYILSVRYIITFSINLKNTLNQLIEMHYLKKLPATLILLFHFITMVTYAQQEPVTLVGKAFDKTTKEPLIGAVVEIKSLKDTTVTANTVIDIDGNFTISTTIELPFLLKISAFGYITKQIDLYELPEVALSLGLDSKNILNEIVVIGYGVQKKEEVVGAISKIDPATTKNILEAGFDSQLAGKASGVQISNNTGVPGSDVFIRVRGTTSINAGNDPLYVIDGVFVNNSSLQNIAQDRATSPLTDINPADIESIEILKDASAVAIYGSRGANGVIIVTTKRGNYEQRSKIEFNASEGEAWAPENRIWKTTTGPEHAMLVNEYNANMGTPLPFRPKEEIINGVAGRGLPEDQPTYDRMSILNRTGHLRNYDLSLQGGSKNTRYYIGGGYTCQEAIWKPMSFERASFKLNLDQKINDRLSLGTSNTFARSYRNQARPANGGNGTLLQASLNIPTYLPIFDSNGLPLKWVNFDNIDVLTSKVNLWSTSYHYIGNLYGDYEVLKNLKFHTSFSMDYDNYDEGEYWDTRTILGAGGGRGSNSVTQSRQLINEQTLRYASGIGKHSFGIIIGNTLQGNEVKNISATGTNFPNNSYTQLSAAANQTASQFKTNNTLASFFSRVDYQLAKKYFVELTIRTDGSSKFGANHKWGYFPAVGAAWRISEEHFIKTIKAVSNLKLRASYGITGNQSGINDFAAQGLWTSGFGYSDKIGGTQSPGTAPLQVGNPDLKWEKTKQLSVGVDIGLFKDRIGAEFNVYNKYTTDLLLQVAVPASSGFTSYWANYGEVSNKGFEIGLTTTTIKTKKFSWKTEFNISKNTNKVEKVPAPIAFAGRDLLRIQEGYSLYSYYLYKQLYVDNQTGNAVFDDINGDGKITADDRQIVGNTLPKLFGGFINTFNYKGFDLGLFFTYSYGNKVWNHNRMLGETGGTLDANRVLLASQLDRWTTPGQSTDTPKLTAENYSRQENSRFLEDGSFIRFRALTFGFTLPQIITKKIKVDKLRLYVTGSNLLLFTNYKGSDPETNLGTGNIQGYDYGTPPQPRSIQFGLNLTL
jgi:TonB-linked SusC/RagA family outer membrane protein